MRKKVYGIDSINNLREFSENNGGTFRHTCDDIGADIYIITAPGYKTAVFKFIGTHTDGAPLYSLRFYNDTPKKYAPQPLKINQYNYEVHPGRDGLPLHIVEIKSVYLAAFSVFSSARDATAYINTEKERHARYNVKLQYNYDAALSPVLLNLYKNARALFSKLEDRQLYIADAHA